MDKGDIIALVILVAFALSSFVVYRYLKRKGDL